MSVRLSTYISATPNVWIFMKVHIVDFHENVKKIQILLKPGKNIGQIS
jgi:hypothetical protein